MVLCTVKLHNVMFLFGKRRKVIKNAQKKELHSVSCANIGNFLALYIPLHLFSIYSCVKLYEMLGWA